MNVNQTAIEECILWVIKQVPFVKDWQLLFLCAILGFLADVMQTNCLLLPKDEATIPAIDELLKNLQILVKRHFSGVPGNCVSLLQKSAVTLVRGCSKPGWLTFAAHFLPLFELEYVLNVRMEFCEYSKEDFFKMFSLLLFSVPSIKRVHYQLRKFFQPLLRRILQFCPNDDVFFALQGNSDVRRFFHSQTDRERFFYEYYKENVNSRNESLGDKIGRLRRIPENVPWDMSALIYAYLDQFIDTVAEPSPDDMDTVLSLISQNLSEQDVSRLLRRLSQSAEGYHRELFVQLLMDEGLTQWGKVPPREKLNICMSWLQTNARSSGCDDEIKATFEALDLLTAFSNISKNTKLIQNLCEKIISQLLEKDPTIILKQFEEIEKYSQPVQNCLYDLVQQILNRNPHFLKDKEILKLLSNAR